MKFAGWLVVVLTMVSCVESTKYSGLGELSVSIPESFDIRTGGSADLPVMVVRGEGHTKAISLEVVGLPSGLTADPAEIPAGESAGFITVRATGAAVSIDYPVIVNAVSQGATATDTSNLYVLGAAGTIDIGFSIAQVPTGMLIGEIPSRAGFLFFNGTSYCLITDRGQEDLTYADGGCIEPASLYLPPPVIVETQLAIQRDQKVVGVSSYKDPQSSNDIDGLVFFRTMADGKFDTTYGPNGNDSKTFVSLPGYMAQRIGVSSTNEVVVWATNGSGDKRLLRVSAQGVLLANRLLGAEGDLGVERRDLLVQDDGKVVAAGSNQNMRFITRFNSDFTTDLYFGFNGIVNTGARVAQVAMAEDGYLAAGQLSTVPTIWRLDTLGRPSPGFSSAGVSFPELGNGFLVSGFATKDRIFVASSTTAAGVISLHLDGTRDRAFASNGYMHLFPFDAGAKLLEMSPTSHSRATIGIRTPPPVRDYITRFWY